MKLHTNIAILFFLVLTGCGTRATETIQPPVSSSRQDDTATSDLVEQSYSEKPEVERLLFRASDAMDSGKFEKALGIVEAALQLDPSSSRAQDMRQRINDILIRS